MERRYIEAFEMLRGRPSEYRGQKKVKVLNRVDERRSVNETIAERISSMVGHLVRHSNWFITLIEGIFEGHSGIVVRP